VNTAPAEAAVMQAIATHCPGSSSSASSTTPASALTTGSRLCSTPTVRGGSLRSAARSSE
jgi:hypothetical protein